MFNASVKFVSKYRLRPSIILLYVGFLTTGAMTVVLGVVLPKIAAAYHLNDSQSGTLLMTLFAGSSLGALCVRQHFQRTLVAGYLLIPVAAALFLSSPHLLAIPAIGIYGFGLGLAMTSTSMLVGGLFPRRRGAALSFLNFCWSIGATLCPLLVARLQGYLTPGVLAIAMAVIAAPFAALPLLGDLQAPERPAETGRPLDTAISTVALFGLAGFLYVGVENAVGGWLTTFTLRTVSWNYSRSSLATACFWAALLTGRGLAPVILARISETRLFQLSVFGLIAGVALLVAAHTPWLLLLAACCTGLSLAPIFPLVLSLFMARAGESKHTGWVFMVSGFGGATLPWLTGLISTQVHSLRIGLLVPLIAAFAMLLLMLRFGLARTPTAASEHASNASYPGSALSDAGS